MKKVFVLLFATMMVAKCFANVSSTETASFDLNLNIREVVRELKLDADDAALVNMAGKDLKKGVTRLSQVAPEKRQEKLTEMVFNNLGAVKPLMTTIQYRKYLSLLNRKFNESGLNSILFGYDYIAEN
jgi:hypothetical protein